MASAWNSSCGRACARAAAAPDRQRSRKYQSSLRSRLVAQAHAHGLERKQQVGEQDRRIEAEIVDRPHRHFGGQLPAACTAR